MLLNMTLFYLFFTFFYGYAANKELFIEDVDFQKLEKSSKHIVVDEFSEKYICKEYFNYVIEIHYGDNSSFLLFKKGKYEYIPANELGRFYQSETTLLNEGSNNPFLVKWLFYKNSLHKPVVFMMSFDVDEKQIFAFYKFSKEKLCLLGSAKVQKDLNLKKLLSIIEKDITGFDCEKSKPLIYTNK